MIKPYTREEFAWVKPDIKRTVEVDRILATVSEVERLEKRVKALEEAGLRAKDTLRQAIWSNNDRLVGLAAGAVVENFDTLIPRKK